MGFTDNGKWEFSLEVLTYIGVWYFHFCVFNCHFSADRKSYWCNLITHLCIRVSRVPCTEVNFRFTQWYDGVGFYRSFMFQFPSAYFRSSNIQDPSSHWVKRKLTSVGTSRPFSHVPLSVQPIYASVSPGYPVQRLTTALPNGKMDPGCYYL